MITKYTLGTPIKTEAVVKNFESDKILQFPFLHSQSPKNFSFEFKMEKSAIVYGLGETVRGINKRGWVYESYCSDDPFHTETKSSLYAAHNFIIYSGSTCFGIFIDFPSRIRWDLGYTESSKSIITIDGNDFDIYVIDAPTPLEIVKEFRGAIGKSYIPPFWSFGFQQSRWSYPDKATVDSIIENYNKAKIPLDCVYLDIDYMERYKDFTVDNEKFPDFANYVQQKKNEGIHLIPIIDAGIKKEDGYDIYEEGKQNDYFCKTPDGKDFEGGVWPGIVGFPDFMRKDVREWFGKKYLRLTDMGIDGFWNDMNEPAIFYTDDGLKKAVDMAVEAKGKNLDVQSFFALKNAFASLSNNGNDYKNMCHTVNGKQVSNDVVHNLYGCNMTKSAGEFFEKEFGKGKILMFSRSSYIGCHRTSGIWFGDNHSWWSHILLCLKMLPSANMCGFLYCGADLGGFNENATRDLVLRFLALGVFTSLMRNHAACGTRNQECFSFENTDEFKNVVEVRYRLIPYLYKTFCKASEENTLIFRPLSFDYPDDKIARECETQLMLGDECMICPVYEQNKQGRYVYLPEDMTFVKLSGQKVCSKPMAKGLHYIDVALDEVPLFIKQNKQIPLCASAMRTTLLDTEKIVMIP